MFTFLPDLRELSALTNCLSLLKKSKFPKEFEDLIQRLFDHEEAMKFGSIRCLGWEVGYEIYY